MARWIRNCFLPTVTSGQSTGALAFFMREAFLVAGWTEFANDGDPDWTAAANVVVNEPGGANGFAVLAANGRQITDPLGRFTQTMADDRYVIALRGSTNDQNYSMWPIVEYIDASTVRVGAHGFSPYGWVDESGIAGRILNYGSAVHLSGAWVEMDAPTGNMRARMEINLSSYVECYVQPKAGLGDTTECPGSALVQLYDNADLKMTLNAYFSGNTAFFWKYADNDGFVDVAMWGELEGVPAADTYPGFVMGKTAAQTNPAYPHLYRLDMLGPQALSIRAYTSFLTRESWATDDTNNLEAQSYYRLINGSPGLLRLRQPQVVLDDTAGNGGFVRGYLPSVRFGPTTLADASPVDAQGQWWHLKNGLYVPRNGPNDPQLVTSYA